MLVGQGILVNPNQRGKTRRLGRSNEPSRTQPERFSKPSAKATFSQPFSCRSMISISIPSRSASGSAWATLFGTSSGASGRLNTGISRTATASLPAVWIFHAKPANIANATPAPPSSGSHARQRACQVGCTQPAVISKSQVASVSHAAIDHSLTVKNPSKTRHARSRGAWPWTRSRVCCRLVVMILARGSIRRAMR